MLMVTRVRIVRKRKREIKLIRCDLDFVCLFKEPHRFLTLAPMEKIIKFPFDNYFKMRFKVMF